MTNEHGLLNDYVNKDYLIELGKQNKPIKDMIMEFMKIGKIVTDKIGHKEYQSLTDFFDTVEKKESPLNVIDSSFKVIARYEHMVWLGITKCPMKAAINDLVNDPNSVNLDVLNTLTNGRDHGISLPYGSYLLLQIRQMVVSSLKVNSDYCLNLLNLTYQNFEKNEEGTYKPELKFNERSIELLAKEEETTEEDIKARILKVAETHEKDICIYAVYCNKDI